MARAIKQGQHIFIAFQDGEAVLDSQLRPRMYKSREQFEKSFPAWRDGKAELVEYAPTLTQPNEPLTLEQLREMDGEPVWCKWLLSEDRSIEQGKWFIVISGDKEGLEIKRPAEYGCHFCKIDDCGKTWLAYRRPQEGEEKTHDERTENPGHERRGVGGHFPQS